MGWGRNASIMHTSLQGQQVIYSYFEKEIKQQSLINQYSVKHCIGIGLTKESLGNLEIKNTRLF